jgi:hypothetical protein
MGYPTSPYATSNSRAALGLSELGSPTAGNLPRLDVYRPRELPGLSLIEQAMMRYPGGSKGPPLVGQFKLPGPGPGFASMEIGRFPSPAIISGGVGGSGFAGLALSVADAFAVGMVGAWALDEFGGRFLNPFVRHGVIGGGYSWADPDAYGTGSFVTECGPGPNSGPWPGEIICGGYASVPDPGGESVDTGYDPQTGTKVVHVTWNLLHQIDPSSYLGYPAVSAGYFWDSPVDPSDPTVKAATPVKNLDGSGLADLPALGAPQMLDPNSTLPLDPGVQPKPMPYALIPEWQSNPFRSPSEQTQKGPKTQTRPRKEPPKRPKWPGPPRKGEKERKVSATQRQIIRFAMAVTEANDFVDNLYDALPKSEQICHGKGALVCKYQQVAKNFKDIDIEKAIENVIINEISDRIIGKIEAQIQRAKIARMAGYKRGTPFGNIWQDRFGPLSPDFEKSLAKAIKHWVTPYVRAGVDFSSIEGLF